MKRIVLLFCFVVFLSAGWAQQPVVGVTLCGGGARAYSHLGVLQALYEYDIYPDIYSGSSMGAIIGAFLANGYTPQELHDIILKEKFNKVNNILHMGKEKGKYMGLSSHKKIKRVFEKYLPHNHFDSLQYPMYICVSNLTSGKAEYVSSGDDLHDYLLGSSSIPALFNPIFIDSSCYVDGGVLDNFPARIIRDKCDVLIGVESGAVLPIQNLKKIKDVAARSISVVVYNNSLPGYEVCDYLINTSIDDRWTILDFKKFEEIYQAGYVAAIKYLQENPELVNRVSNPQKRVKNGR